MFALLKETYVEALTHDVTVLEIGPLRQSLRLNEFIRMETKTNRTGVHAQRTQREGHRKVSPKTSPTGTLKLDFQLPELIGHDFCGMSHLVCGSQKRSHRPQGDVRFGHVSGKM